MKVFEDNICRIYKPSLWTRIRMLFAKTHVGIDHGVKDGDYTCKTYMKKIGDKTIITDIKYEQRN